MVLPQLTYSTEELFTTALVNAGVEKFLIPAYQRGYKWKAEELVLNLMESLWQAYESDAPEYYLQYLTVKETRTDTGTHVLEVIDGQQRLTTLTLFFAVTRLKGHLAEDFTDEKIDYAIRKMTVLDGPAPPKRKSLLQQFIYAGQLANTLGTDAQGTQIMTWEQFAKAHPGADRQDMYHLFQAAGRMLLFLNTQEAKTGQKVAGFAAYVAAKVRLIVNQVDTDAISETVFGNLNKPVFLTDLDLVKGYLLTRVAREGSQVFQQIVEVRVAQGQQWDEMARWLLEPGVRAVFRWVEKTPINPNPGLTLLIDLVLKRDQKARKAIRAVLEHTSATPPLAPSRSASTPKTGRYPLFSKLRRQTPSREDQTPTTRILRDLRMLHGLLRNWYEDPTMRNCLGVLYASNGYAGKRLELLPKLVDIALSNGPLKPHVFLWREMADLMPKARTKLFYGEHSAIIHDMFLLLNVFPEQVRSSPGSSDIKTPATFFDFDSLLRQDWSLEHIFPQNPDETYQALDLLEDRSYVLSMVAEENRAEVELLLAIHPKYRSQTQTDQLKEMLRGAYDKLNGIGNLVWLPLVENIRLSNHSFLRKRQILADRVEAGAFVPPHTFGVFAKYIPRNSTSSLQLWTEQDINAHEEYLQQQQQGLFAFLQQNGQN